MIDRKGVDLVDEVEKRQLFLVNKGDGRPVPSNKWFQNLIYKQFGTGLWAMPQKVDATAEGLEIFHATSFSGDGVRTIAEFPLVITGKEFKPVDSRAKNWTDWTVSFRSFETDSRFVDVTLGEGMPAVWCEFSGVQPIIAFGGQQGKGSRGKKSPTFFQLDGANASLPIAGDTLGISYEGRAYGVFAPGGTKFEQADVGVTVTFAERAPFLSSARCRRRRRSAIFTNTPLRFREIRSSRGTTTARRGASHSTGRLLQSR
jgi:hypothetical protein